MNVEETSPSKPAAAVPNRKSGGTGDRPDRSDTDSREALDALLGDQLEYYQARAGEYDQWFLREGRYDRGEELNQLWFEEVALVQAALARAHPGGR
ncbi:MAG: hypothetical protein R3E12_17755, partial [Candidatus Eisenbacteria bacterium]